MLNWWQRIAAFFLACAAFQLLVASGAAAEPYTAEEMLSECQASSLPPRQPPIRTR